MSMKKSLLTACIAFSLTACGGAGPEGTDDKGAASDDAGPVVSNADAAPADDAAVWCGPGLGVGSQRCDGNRVQVCDTDGKWSDGAKCGANSSCSGGVCVPNPCPEGQIQCCQVSACYCQSAADACD
jgi:hypothetical protein